MVFFSQVVGNVKRDLESHSYEVKDQVYKELVEEVRKRLNEMKEEMRDTEQFASFNKKKTPTAVLNHLTTIVDKYLDILPEQPTIYGILIQIRDNDLLRCLLNISIYMGTLDKPEEFINELKQLYQEQGKNPQSQTTLTTQQLPILNTKLSKKDRRKMAAMMQQQQQAQITNTESNEENVSLV